MINYPTKKLGEVIHFLKGKKMPVTEEQLLGYEPYIGIDTLRTREYKLFTPEKDGVRCSKHDVLVVWDGAYAGTVGIEVSGFAGSTVAKVVIKEPDLDSRFLRYFWEFNGTKIRNAAQGAAIPHLSKPFINNLKIPLLPLETQKQIVERLDKIAEAQKLNDDLIQKTDGLFQSLLHQELNPASKNWIVKRLKEISEINPSKAEINKLPENTIVSFLAMADVSENAEIINRQEKNLSEAKNGFTFFKDGDVLVAKITPCFENGKGAFVEAMKNGVGFGSTEFHILRANQEVLLNKFLYYLVSDKKFRKVGAKFMTGSAGQQRISKQYLENYKIPLPPPETQKKIVEKLSSVQNYKKQLLEQKKKLKELFDGALHKSMKPH